MSCETFQANKTIIQQDDEYNNKLYIILTGKVRILPKKEANMLKS